MAKHDGTIGCSLDDDSRRADLLSAGCTRTLIQHQRCSHPLFLKCRPNLLDTHLARPNDGTTTTASQQ